MRIHSFPGALWATVLLVASATTARADNWTHPRHDAQASGATTERVSPPLKPLWSITGATNEPLLVSGNSLFYTAKTAAGLRDLVALDLSTRKPRWRVPNVTQPGAVAPDGKVICTVVRTTTKPTTVSKLGANLWPCAVAGVDTATGKVLWKYPIGEHPVYPAISSLTVVAGTVYLVKIPYCVPGDPCEKGEFLALNTANGKERGVWAWDEIFGGQIGVVSGAPIVDAVNSRVAFGLGYQAAPGSYGGQVLIFNAAERVSEGPVHILGDPSLGTGEISPYAHKGGNAWPLLGGSFLAVQGPESTTRVWNVKEFPARLTWEIKFTRGLAHSIMPGGANPMILEHNSGTNLLTAMYLSSGKNIWSRTLRVTGLSATAGGVVYVPGRERPVAKASATGRTDIWIGALHALDATTGRTLWTYRKPDVTFNTPSIAGGKLYLSDSDGVIMCFAPSVPAKPAPAKKPAAPAKKR